MGNAKGKMSIDLYSMLESPPCRAVQMTAKILNVDLNVKQLDFVKGEHLTNEEFAKMNPRKLVPTMNDNGFVLTESRAIMRYLVGKYGGNDRLYPRDVCLRAKVDEMLDLDIGTIYNELCLFLGPVIFEKPVNTEHEAKFLKSLTMLDTFLDGKLFLATDKLTIADISLIAGLSFAEAIEFDFSKYCNVVEWMKRVKKSIACYDEINTKAMEYFTAFMQHCMKKNVK